MKYQIYNPATVSYEELVDLSEAVARRDELRAAVDEMFPFLPTIPPECAMLKDWEVAETFFANKTGATQIDFTNADRIALGGAGNTTYSHSVFNASTSEHWSRTFAYVLSDSLFHIKVRNGQVTDWYQYHGSLDGLQREWVAFDLNSGEVIEYYEMQGSVQTKRILATPNESVVTTFSTPPDDLLARLPIEVKRGQIFAYASKAYGDIVEYQEFVTIESLSEPVRSAVQSRISQLESLTNEQRALTRSQIVVLQIGKNPDGTESLTNIDDTL